MEVPALGPLVRGLNENKMLAPVGTLKIYRAKTNSIRKQNPQMKSLFISYMKGFSKDIWKKYTCRLDEIPHQTSIWEISTSSFPNVCC